MSVKPILFSTEMVRAILDGRKTVTRRVVKPQPVGKLAYCMAGYKHGTWGYPSDDVWKYWGDAYKRDTPIPEIERLRHWTPPYHTDDVLWVRETWAHVKFGLGEWHYEYRANCEHPKKWSNGSFAEWRPSIHMPREAARIFLRVTDVRVERLQEMRAEDSLREGVKLHLEGCLNGEAPLKPFADLWDSTIKPADRERYGWAANPWVFRVEFERCEKPEEV